MNVLSLFDGMSCGRLALDRNNISVKNYYASEINKNAITIAKKNYPDIKHIGDVSKNRVPKGYHIDLLLGGSPCQGFSFIGKQLNFEDVRSKLFFEYVRLLKEIRRYNPNVKFLLENVCMSKESEKIITGLIGVDPIFINSVDFCPQNRRRLYWTNIDFLPYEKLNKDWRDYKDTDYKSLRQAKPNNTPSRREIWGNGINGKCTNITHRSKTNCITTKQDRAPNAGVIEFEDFYRYLTPLECERLQTLPDNYTLGVANTKRYEMIGNGWTVDVISHILKGL